MKPPTSANQQTFAEQKVLKSHLNIGLLSCTVPILLFKTQLRQVPLQPQPKG